MRHLNYSQFNGDSPSSNGWSFESLVKRAESLWMLVAVVCVHRNCSLDSVAIWHQYLFGFSEMIYVLAGWIAYARLQATWTYFQTLASSGVSPLRKRVAEVVTHAILFILETTVPLLLFQLFVVLITGRTNHNLAQLIYPTTNPVFGPWFLRLTSQDVAVLVHWPDPNVSHLSCLALFTLTAPLFFHLARFGCWCILRPSTGVSLYQFAAPMVVLWWDYWWLSYRLPSEHHLSASGKANLERAVVAAPEAHFGKFTAGMLCACLLPPSPVPALRLVPLVDIVLIVQIALYQMVPLSLHSAHSKLLSASLFTPGACLVVWAVLHRQGLPLIASRILTSQVTQRIAGCPGTGFLVFALHIPVVVWVRGSILKESALVLMDIRDRQTLDLQGF
eukprot:Protomagalhaensia_sp_Gyna_25__350@NODE_1164_length_2117_cov_7_101059_g923_i0_p1_GENE_NODE_1164_length_2117_cov_7_101059_g923_i0NODE_1164_length_2117_cov_7_101059_g923_i0_p1_ORF_typecomplete_len390_score12_74DUF4389/PF14333_6/6_6e02DUF4389/PF14333_6/0_15_NODE_1164_length_2117_cov_7_101059_g923_i01021271